MTIVPKEHPLANYSEVSPEQVNNENVLLLGEGHCFRDQVIEALPAINQNTNETGLIRTVAEGSSLETLCYMVASGLGITILPKSATEVSSFQATNLLAIPFSDNGPKRTTALAWRASFPRHQAIDALRKAILTSDPKLSN